MLFNAKSSPHGKPNARTGERHTGKTESAPKGREAENGAEALIVEDAYQKGYADAMADMRKKKEQEATAGAGKESPPLVFH